MCSACSGDYEEPIEEQETDCKLCGESLCKHGLCTATGDERGHGECPNSRGTDGYQCQDCAEAQQQQSFEDYYGGNGPQTDREFEEVRRMQR